jgi:hypothetical protein
MCHTTGVDVLVWWRGCVEAKELPTWRWAARLVLHITPSSAAAERIFSCLKRSFGDQQYLALRDIIETSVMLQMNHGVL